MPSDQGLSHGRRSHGKKDHPPEVIPPPVVLLNSDRTLEALTYGGFTPRQARALRSD